MISFFSQSHDRLKGGLAGILKLAGQFEQHVYDALRALAIATETHGFGFDSPKIVDKFVPRHPRIKRLYTLATYESAIK